MFQSCLAACSSRRALRATALVALAILSAARPAWLQTRTATLAVTVVDQTGAVVGGATVTVTGTDDVTKAAGPTAVTTSSEGIGTLPNPVPGRYTIEAQFPGFKPRVLANVAMRSGNNKQVALLTVAGLKDSVTVARDRQEAAGASRQRERAARLRADARPLAAVRLQQQPVRRRERRCRRLRRGRSGVLDGEPRAQHPGAALRPAGPACLHAVAAPGPMVGFRVALRVRAAHGPGERRVHAGRRTGRRGTAVVRVHLGSDLDYVRSIHSLRTGILVDGGSVRADDTSNHLGTYTFESLDAYLAGRPRSYTRRIGDPRIRYDTVQAAVYLQDDIKIRRNFTVSAGGRYEAQSHVRDYGSLMLRVGFTWAPFRSGTTVLRSSYGIFYDWLQGSTYEQTLRVDGFRQRELDIRDPSYPEIPAVDDVGLTLPVSRYVLSDGLELPRTTRLSAGIDQRIPKTRVQMSAVYAYQRGSDQYRGNNLNAPVDGIRPDPSFGNVIEVLADASSRQHQLQTAFTVNPGALLPLPPSARRISWMRTTLFVNYTLGVHDNHADGPFSIPAGGRLAGEWGPAASDVRHRFNTSLNNQIVRNLLVALNLNVNTATPYSIRTGRDDNGDFVFNDRPGSLGRNTERGATQWSLNPFMANVFTFGRNISDLPPGIAVIGGGAGGAPTVQSVNQPANRYRLQLFLQAQNITNHANYSGYSGTMTSQFFGQPTNVMGTRKIDIGMSLTF